jgi:hypothetical protein
MAHMSQRQAASQWHMSRATLQRAIKAGKLSLTPDKTIDHAEMLRAFGEPNRPEIRPVVPDEPTHEPARIVKLETENAMLRELVRSKDEHLADMRNQVQRLTHESGPARSRHSWWPWGKA